VSASPDSPRNTPAYSSPCLLANVRTNEDSRRCPLRDAAGRELRVYFEPESAADVLHSQGERFDFAVLEQKAEELRAILQGEGMVAGRLDGVNRIGDTPAT
jgi:hypothetical protein